MIAELRRIVGSGLRRADFLLQPHFRLAQELFVEDHGAGARVRSVQEWSNIRRAEAGPTGESGHRYASDKDYRRYLTSIRESKILSVCSLVDAFDFGRYARILELGCGDMPQASVICARYPGILYTATDFDPFVIDSCARVPMLNGIRKHVLDVTRSDLREVGEHDLVMSWSLEFELDDTQLVNLFAACRRLTVPYLLCSHTTIGPLGYLSWARSPAARKRAARMDGVRPLGWLRSVGEIARLAGEAGMTLRSNSYHVNHAALFFAPDGH